MLYAIFMLIHAIFITILEPYYYAILLQNIITTRPPVPARALFAPARSSSPVHADCTPCTDLIGCTKEKKRCTPISPITAKDVRMYGNNRR